MSYRSNMVRSKCTSCSEDVMLLFLIETDNIEPPKYRLKHSMYFPGSIFPKSQVTGIIIRFFSFYFLFKQCFVVLADNMKKFTKEKYPNTSENIL